MLCRCAHEGWDGQWTGFHPSPRTSGWLTPFYTFSLYLSVSAILTFLFPRFFIFWGAYFISVNSILSPVYLVFPHRPPTTSFSFFLHLSLLFILSCIPVLLLLSNLLSPRLALIHISSLCVSFPFLFLYLSPLCHFLSFSV